MKKIFKSEEDSKSYKHQKNHIKVLGYESEMILNAMRTFMSLNHR